MNRARATIFRGGNGLIAGIRVAGDDVPGMEETGEEPEATERDVDEGVGAAYASLDPDAHWWEENAKDGEKEVDAGTHVGLREQRRSQFARWNAMK